MSRNLKVPNYVKVIVIVHGKSEIAIVKHIKSNLRLPIEIYSNKNGKNNIEISSLKAILGNNNFKTLSSLKKKYQIAPLKYFTKNDLEIFTIMDRDNCDSSVFEQYQTGEMFEHNWLSHLLTPIYNIECLEDVLIKAGYPDLSQNKKGYSNLFPVGGSESDIDRIKLLYDNLKKSEDISNMHLFIKKCIELTSE